jgi:hypothetical protein
LLYYYKLDSLNALLLIVFGEVVKTHMNSDCCCTSASCHAQPHGRHFLTKEEKIRQLENYAEELKKEIGAVEEKIKELKS